MKFLRHFAFCFFAVFAIGYSSSLLAQEPLPAGPPAASSGIYAFPLYTLNVAPVPGATKQIVGVSGQQTYYYWAVANYPIGSVVSPLGRTSITPNTLSSSNYVVISPFSYPPSATVDILRTTTDLAPAHGCLQLRRGHGIDCRGGS